MTAKKYSGVKLTLSRNQAPLESEVKRLSERITQLSERVTRLETYNEIEKSSKNRKDNIKVGLISAVCSGMISSLVYVLFRLLGV